MSRLRGAGIGAGYFAPFQYEAWARIPEVEIVAISNPTETKARQIMASCGVSRYYADWRQMLDQERPDFVDIITPPDTHEAICAEATARG
ncbi:MAG: Gfo/Idh/MocA family oxidoreductase, partial [Acidobacteriota bacterium]